MEPQSVDSLNNPPKNTKNFLKWIFFLLFIFLVVYFVSPSSLLQKKLTGLEVAVKINTFLDKTLQEDGGMLGGIGCSLDTKKCSGIIAVDDQPHLGQAIYSYYLLSQVTGDNSYRQKSDKSMNFVLDKCQNNIQMCSWNFFPMARYYFDTKEEKYLNGMIMLSKEFLAMPNSSIINQNVGHKLASLYKATNDEKFKNRLLEVASHELTMWPYGPEVNSGKGIQVVWSLFLPAYEITKDKRYLIASESLFDSLDLSKNFYRFLFLDPIIKGIDALIILSEVSDKGAIYKEQAHKALQEVINKYWDTPENTKINGDYGFMEIPENGNINSVNKKTITNGWISKSFIRLQNDKFNLPTK